MRVDGRQADLDYAAGDRSKAPIAVIRGRQRWRLLARAPCEVDIQAFLRMARKYSVAEG